MEEHFLDAMLSVRADEPVPFSKILQDLGISAASVDLAGESTPGRSLPYPTGQANK